jgi:molybdate transport system substrate-binding protein
MNRSPRVAAAVVALMLAAILGACGSTTPSTTAPATPPAVTGALTVFAAASLTEAFRDAEPPLQRRHPGVSARYSFAGSQQLVTNLLAGAPADVIATADMASMKQLTDAGLVDTPRTFASNRLEMAVAPSNPKGVHTLADLARPDLTVVLEDPSVPAGKFARQALQKAHVSVTPKSNELDVKATLQKVVSGDADAAIVYVTDVSSATGRVSGVVIPDADNVTAIYPIAVVRASGKHDAAALFVDEAASGAVQDVLRNRGFGAP